MKRRIVIDSPESSSPGPAYTFGLKGCKKRTVATVTPTKAKKGDTETPPSSSEPTPSDDQDSGYETDPDFESSVERAMSPSIPALPTLSFKQLMGNAYVHKAKLTS